MAQFTVEIDGQSHTVDLDAVPTSELQKSYVPKDFMEQEVTRRAKSMAKGMAPSLEDILKEDDHRNQALKILGVDPKKGSTPEDLAAKYQEWEAKHLNPLKEEATTYKEQVQSLRSKVLEKDIIQAAVEAGVRDEFLKSVRPGQSPLIVKMMTDLFDLDEESGQFLVKRADGNGFEYASKPSQDSPFKTIQEFFSEWAEDKANAGFLKDQRQRGPGIKEGGRGAIGVEDFQKMSGPQRAALYRENPEQYRNLMAQIQQANEAKLYNK